MSCFAPFYARQSDALRHPQHANLRIFGWPIAWHNLAPSKPVRFCARMLRLRFRKIGSLLGLLAILMTSLAPTISQALAAQNRVDALLSIYCTAQPAAASDTGESDKASHDALAHLQACGYCSLLTHTPALPTPEASFAATVQAIHQRAETRFESLRRVMPLTAAQPRAPPFSS
jgi:hypothetical protein